MACQFQNEVRITICTAEFWKMMMVKNAQCFKNNETFLWFIINLLISGTFWVKLTDVEKLRMGCTKNLIFAAILLLIYPIKSWKIIDIETLGISWGVEEECIRSRLRFCWDYQWSTLVLHPMCCCTYTSNSCDKDVHCPSAQHHSG